MNEIKRFYSISENIWEYIINDGDVYRINLLTDNDSKDGISYSSYVISLYRHNKYENVTAFKFWYEVVDYFEIFD